ncbi:MAG: replication-associated recombination protein A [candidate division WOR-3 bacterium]
MEIFEKYSDAPLALRVAPSDLDEVVGQDHIIGKGKPLRRLIETGTLRAAIFFGPPGTGKTSVARIIAKRFGSRVFHVNASELKPRDLVAALEAAEKFFQSTGNRALVFVDEIHRFDRRSQEVLLSRLERGGLVFIGSTVHNPGFALSKAILSRVLLFEFRELKHQDVFVGLKRAVEKEGLEVSDAILERIAGASEGDLRRALNYLEASAVAGRIEEGDVCEVLSGAHLRFDRTGDERYDMISALIKSIRGSDPDAAAYWFIRLLDAGEDPLYIARRLQVHAAEDIGLADPRAILVAEAATSAFERVGRPEGDIILMEAVLFLATRPKSNTVVRTIWAVRSAISDGKVYPVPSHLQDSHYSLAEKLGRGKGYKYPYADKSPQAYLPPELLGTRFFEPSDAGEEKKLKGG